MEPNSKRVTVINVNDSSVNSLISSFGQLDETTSGPINGLPNEIVKHILTQLEQKPGKSYYNYEYYYDVKLLVQLRLVCTRWRGIVEDFCRKKKSLCVNSGHKSELDFDNSVPLIVNWIQSAAFFSVMPKLFPNIVKLDIGFLPNLEDTEMANIGLFISQLSSLKQLELVGLEKVLPFLSQTLSQLEHILVFTSDDYKLTEKEFFQFVGSLGPDCVRVFLAQGIELNYQKLRQWHNLKPNFFANVTHFEFAIEQAYQQVVHFLREHAPSLKLLNFFAQDDLLELTATLLADLGNLTNLTELELWNICLELSELEEAAARNQLPRLSSVTVCSLIYIYVKWSDESSVDQFMRILSIIFPNLVYLKLELQLEMDTLSQKLPSKQEFAQYLDRFPNLHSHAIDISKF